MGARLTTAIKIARTAKGILRKSRSFPPLDFDSPDAPNDLSDIGVEPILLALAMELALKAWIVFDHNDVPKELRQHDLEKLFNVLKPASQAKLDAEFKRSVAPCHPDFLYIDYGIRHVLHQHKDAFITWRYIHELEKPTIFKQSVFEATLEMVLAEFDKRYFEVKISTSGAIQDTLGGF